MTPLAGKTVVVTRPAHQAEELARPLREAGADVILLPTIDIAPPSDPEPLISAVEHLDSYDWILFTSANAVSAVARLISNGSRRPRGRIACVGTATKHAIEALGWHVELVPDQFVAEALAEALTEAGIRGARILIPSAAVTRDVLSKTLTEHGADVHIVEAYRNVMPDAAAESALELFSSAIKPDWVTFTSSSSVDNLIAVTGPARLKEVKIACIGPITAASVRAHGLSVDVQPQEHSVTKMLQAIFEVK